MIFYNFTNNNTDLNVQCVTAPNNQINLQIAYFL